MTDFVIDSQVFYRSIKVPVILDFITWCVVMLGNVLCVSLLHIFGAAFTINGATTRVQDWHPVLGEIEMIRAIVRTLFRVCFGGNRTTGFPRHVRPHQPMRQWVLSVPFPLRFLFAGNPKVMTRVLAIVYRTIATHLAHKAGFTKPSAKTGAVTLIQRFGSALNLNIHFHMLILDGVYIGGTGGLPLRFRQVKAPTGNELTKLAHTIASRVGRYLERQGLLRYTVQ